MFAVSFFVRNVCLFSMDIVCSFFLKFIHLPLHNHPPNMSHTLIIVSLHPLQDLPPDPKTPFVPSSVHRSPPQLQPRRGSPITRSTSWACRRVSARWYAIAANVTRKLLGHCYERSKDATSSSWPYYYRNKKLLGTKGIATNREQGCYTLFAQVFSGVATDVC